MRKPRKQKVTAENLYLASRAFSSFLALIFSIIYSRSLGPENRGVLGAVFLIVLLLWQIICGGFNLTFRTSVSKWNPEDYVWRFLKISSLLACLVAIVGTISIYIYAQNKNSLTKYYIVVSFLYFLITVLSDQLTQLMLALLKFEIVWKVEILTISLQIFFYFILIQISQVSVGIAVLLSLLFSYLFVIGWYLKFLISGQKYIKLKNSSSVLPINFFQNGSKNYVFVIFSSLADRADRLIVLLVFSSAMFGKYAVMTGLLLAFRFIPESLSNLILSGRAKRIVGFVTKFRVMDFFLVMLLPLIATFILRILVNHIFGENWLITFWAIALFAFSELLRTVYIIRITATLHSNISTSTHIYAASLILVTESIFAFFAWHFNSIAIVPAGLCLGYALSIYLIGYSRPVSKMGGSVDST